MGTIRNSARRNIYGGGYEKIYTADNGDKFVIRNSPLTNNIGGGYRQEVVKVSSGNQNDGQSTFGRFVSKEEWDYVTSNRCGIKIVLSNILIIGAVIGFMALLIGLIPLLGWIATL